MLFARYVASMIARTKDARALHDDSVHKTVVETNRDGFSFAEMAKTVPPKKAKRFLNDCVQLIPILTKRPDDLVCRQILQPSLPKMQLRGKLILPVFLGVLIY